MTKLKLPRKTKDKNKERAWGLAHNRKVLWRDPDGYWHAATNRDNTPNWAVEVEDIT